MTTAEAFVMIVTTRPAPNEAQERDRIRIVQEFLDEAGYRVRATCTPDARGDWPTAPTGDEWDVVNLWLTALVAQVRQKAERSLLDAVAFVDAQLDARRPYRARQLAPAGLTQ